MDRGASQAPATSWIRPCDTGCVVCKELGDVAFCHGRRLHHHIAVCKTLQLRCVCCSIDSLGVALGCVCLITCLTGAVTACILRMRRYAGSAYKTIVLIFCSVARFLCNNELHVISKYLLLSTVVLTSSSLCLCNVHIIVCPTANYSDYYY